MIRMPFPKHFINFNWLRTNQEGFVVVGSLSRTQYGLISHPLGCTLRQFQWLGTLPNCSWGRERKIKMLFNWKWKQNSSSMRYRYWSLKTSDLFLSPCSHRSMTLSANCNDTVRNCFWQFRFPLANPDPASVMSRSRALGQTSIWIKDLLTWPWRMALTLISQFCHWIAFCMHSPFPSEGLLTYWLMTVSRASSDSDSLYLGLEQASLWYFMSQNAK